MSHDIQDFFETFERNAASLDLDAICAQYADPFLSADPSGTRPVPLALFRSVLPKRREMFQSLGLVSTRLVSVDPSPLDDHYILVRTEWLWEFARPEKIELRLPSTFLLRRDHGLKIVLYLLHQDVAKLLAESGPLASS